MPNTDPRVDAYIAEAAPFARPILTHLRRVVHAACPTVEETIKWRFPNFVLDGSILCHMAAFRQHCSFGFWKGDLVFGEGEAKTGAMGQLGRLCSLADLPTERELKALLGKAVKLNSAGLKPKPRPAKASPVAAMPDELLQALRADADAQAQFEAFSPGRRREYAEWIAEAKTAATRERRLAQAIAWIAEGKPRNWKYMKPWGGCG